MLSLFPRDVLDEIWDITESVSEGFLTYIFPIQGNKEKVIQVVLLSLKWQEGIGQICPFKRDLP